MLQIFSRRRLSGNGGAADGSRKRLIGKLLDQRYRIVDVLGEGGFSYTYIAEDTHRPKKPDYPKCVVKQLRKSGHNPDFLKTAQRLFRTEAETLEILGGHSQIPRLLSYKEEQGYLVQEYFEGHPLSNELQPGRCWSESRVYAFLCEMLKILVFVHGHGVIHRDIKPDNIIRRRYDRTLCLVDFGAVKQSVLDTVTSSLKQTVTAGTPGYIPLEQWQGSPQLNSDIYALGIVAAQALTGLEVEQFQGNPERILRQARPSIGEALLSIIYKMVKSDWQERYQSAQAVLQALTPLSEQCVSTVVTSKPSLEESTASESSISPPELIAAVDPIEQQKVAPPAIVSIRNQRETILESPSIEGSASNHAVEINAVASASETGLASPLADQLSIDSAEAGQTGASDGKTGLEPFLRDSSAAHPPDSSLIESPIIAQAPEPPLAGQAHVDGAKENLTRVSSSKAVPFVSTPAKWQIILGLVVVGSGVLAAGVFLLLLPWRASQAAEQTLQQAKDQLRKGNYADCVNQAGAVSSNFVSLKSEAEKLVQGCSTLRQAESQNDPRQAIKQLASLTPTHLAYDKAQTMMQKMGDRLLDQASEKYQKGALTSAISLLQDLPAPLKTKVQPKIDRWSLNQKHFTAALAATKDEKWQDVLNAVKKINTSDNPYLAQQVTELRKQAQLALAKAEAALSLQTSNSTVNTVPDSPQWTDSASNYIPRPVSPPPAIEPLPQPEPPSRSGPCAPRARVTSGC